MQKRVLHKLLKRTLREYHLFKHEYLTILFSNEVDYYARRTCQCLYTNFWLE